MEVEESPSEEKETNNSSQNQVPNDKENTVQKNNCWCPQHSIVIEPLAFFIFFSEAISGSVLTNFIITRTCENHFKFNNTVCDQLENLKINQSDMEALVQPYASVILTGMSLLSLFLPAVMSLFLGSWSDGNGRKLLFVIPSLGYLIKYLLLIMFSYTPNMNPALGLVVVIPVAFSGGFISIITAFYSYISDITSEENRSLRLSILESSMVCGGITGLWLTSPIFKAGGRHGYALIFGVSSVGFLLSLILSCFFLPESVKITQAGKGLLHMFELKLLKDMLKVCFKKRKGFRRAAIFLVIFSGTAAISQMEGEANILFLFTRLKFGWDIQKYTTWCVVNLVCGFFGNVLIFQFMVNPDNVNSEKIRRNVSLLLGTLILIKLMKLSDSFLGVISCTVKAASCFYLVFIPSNAPSMMYYTGLICCLSGLISPAGRSILSKIVSSNDLGKVFALAGSFEAVFPLIVAPIYTGVYDSTIKTFPSAVFLVSGSIFIVNIVVWIFLYLILKTTDESESVEEDESRTYLINE